MRGYKTCRAGVRAACALSFSLALAGCGFQPLYGKAGAVSAETLSAIEVPPLPDREGQLVHQYLTRDLDPTGRSEASLYRLDIGLVTQRSNLGIRKDQTATRANLTLSANVVLIELATGKPIYRTSTFVTNSYNIVEAQFATVAAEIDATDRAARALAENIRTRVAAFLARHKSQAELPR